MRKLIATGLMAALVIPAASASARPGDYGNDRGYDRAEVSRDYRSERRGYRGDRRGYRQASYDRNSRAHSAAVLYRTIPQYGNVIRRPGRVGLPRAHGPREWLRHGSHVALVNVRTGRVIELRRFYYR